MRCAFCDSPMERDNQFDPICPNGCRKCNLCDRQAAPDSDGCPVCDLEGLLYEMKGRAA